MEHGVTFQGIACKVVGGLSFFGVSNNMSLVGSIALLTYLRTCKKWAIDLGKYDYKLFAIISLLSFTLTLIGVPSFGPKVNFRNKVVQKLGNNSRLSRLEIIVARKITGYILIFILQWTPTMFYVIGQICGYDKIWMYTLTEVAEESSSETLTERSDEYINDGNITPSKIKVHEIVT
ncbi:14150_t:CDS:2, partial [Gigaspora margarita]